MEEKIEIPLSKLKIGLLFIVALVFVVLGAQFVLDPEEWITPQRKSLLLIRGIGVISTVFFGICGIAIGKKLLNREIGLTIDDSGITDNTNSTSIGLIEWDDITGIEKVEIVSIKILIIKTNNPSKYIEKAKNGVAKGAMKVNNKIYGSPLSIISSSLKIRFTKLENLLITELEKRKKELPYSPTINDR